jgi:hypothetical protein
MRSSPHDRVDTFSHGRRQPDLGRDARRGRLPRSAEGLCARRRARPTHRLRRHADVAEAASLRSRHGGKPVSPACPLLLRSHGRTSHCSRRTSSAPRRLRRTRYGREPAVGSRAAGRSGRTPTGDVPRRLNLTRGCGGIGRRGGFRSRWAQALGGSSPLARTRPPAARLFHRRWDGNDGAMSLALAFVLTAACVGAAAVAIAYAVARR